MSKKKPDYNSSSIQALKGLAAVRRRTSMYLGSPTDGNALHHCIKEVVDNCVDEHTAGHCDKILIELLPDGACRVSDNGRGIPIGPHPTEPVDTLELVMCTLHAGGKFDDESYEGSSGLHGIGVAAVNAVSSRCTATVHREGYEWAQSYSEGVATTPVTRGKKSAIHGTTIEWVRDLEIFSGVTEYDRKQVQDRLQEIAFLNPGLSIILSDTRSAKFFEKTFNYEGGIKDYIAEIAGKKATMSPILYFETALGAKVGMLWTNQDGEDIRCYANNTFNRDGGTHLVGFKAGLTKLIQNYAKEHGLTKGLGEEGITGSDTREGLIAVITVKIKSKDIAFSSQTKDKLVTPGARQLVEDLFSDQVAHFLEANPGIARKIAERAVVSAKAREAARKARDQVKRKEWMELSSLPGKLSDCQSKDPKECEIYIVEGDSASGTCKGARDRKYQAILPLRGKVLNVERSSAESILENKEIGTIITALGCGIEQTSSFKLKDLRYHKVILMTDSDVDGAHIRTLLLTMLYRCMPRLIYHGHVYFAVAPLFGARFTGAHNEYFFSDEAALTTFKGGLSERQLQQLKLTRYKGLGELNAIDLWATTMDPAVRVLKQVTVQDAIQAETFFDLFMGEDVNPRREYIENNAQYAHLDL